MKLGPKILRPKKAPPLPTSGDPLREFVAGKWWGEWPERWRSGLSASVRPTSRGAWTAPEALGQIRNNLTSMRKRLDSIGRVGARARALAAVVREHERTGRVDVSVAKELLAR